jgi:SAM-dependent methyltransferase
MLKHISRENAKALMRDPSQLPRALRLLLSGKQADTIYALTKLVEHHEACLSAIGQVAGVPLKPQAITDVLEDIESTTHCKDLAELFKLHGSDKSTKHDYHRIYSAVLAGRRLDPLKILEIGIGTNDPTRTSTMGTNGTPGASLRAWRDWAPHATVYGADIDRNVLFKEDRISTYYVDQLDHVALDELASEFEPNSFDLVIDDGLHEPLANLNSLKFASKLVKPTGYIVVEDIVEADAIFWPAIIGAARPRLTGYLLQTKTVLACLFMAERSVGLRTARRRRHI